METHLGYWLRLVSNEVTRSFARALQDQGLSVAEWVAMNQIAAGPAATPAALAASMAMTRGAISKVIDKLESKRLVARSGSPEDGRAWLLSLTELGQRILPELTEIADRNDRHYFSVLGSREQSTLRALLHALAQHHHITRIPAE